MSALLTHTLTPEGPVGDSAQVELDYTVDGTGAAPIVNPVSSPFEIDLAPGQVFTGTASFISPTGVKSDPTPVLSFTAVDDIKPAAPSDLKVTGKVKKLQAAV